MQYTQIPLVYLIDQLTLSESIVYSIINQCPAHGLNTRAERLHFLLSQSLHAITRVTVNVAIKNLKLKNLINDDLDIIGLPQLEAIPPPFETKAGRPHYKE